VSLRAVQSAVDEASAAIKAAIVSEAQTVSIPLAAPAATTPSAAAASAGQADRSTGADPRAAAIAALSADRPTSRSSRYAYVRSRYKEAAESAVQAALASSASLTASFLPAGITAAISPMKSPAPDAGADDSFAVDASFRSGAPGAEGESGLFATAHSQSAPLPAAAKYIPGRGHTREWVDPTNRRASELASRADAQAALGIVRSNAARSVSRSRDPGATIQSLTAGGSVAAESPARGRGRSVSSRDGNWAASTTRSRSALGAASFLSSKIATATSTILDGSANPALFATGSRTGPHPSRRSAKAQALQDELEIARAKALGLMVGSRTRAMSHSDVNELSTRLYSRAQEMRDRMEQRRLTLLDEDDSATFTPAITAKAAALGNKVLYPVAMNVPAEGAAEGGADQSRIVTEDGEISEGVTRHELLYANAKARLLRLEEAALNCTRGPLLSDNEHCTFAPAIDPRSKAMAESRLALSSASDAAGPDTSTEATLRASLRLYQEAVEQEERRKERARSHLAATTTGLFKPELDAKSLSMAARPTTAYVSQRPQLHERRPENTYDALAARKEELDVSHCTFLPSVNDSSTVMANRGVEDASRPVEERLLFRGQQTLTKRTQRAEELLIAQLAAAPFRPLINPASEKLVESVRGRRTPLDPATALSDAAQRLYQEAVDMRERKEALRRQDAEAFARQFSFKPTVDEHSAEIVRRNRPAPSDTQADGATSGPNPVVWDRLYQEANDFAQSRAELIEAAIRRELDETASKPGMEPFQPSINDRSRRISKAASSVLEALAAMRPDQMNQLDATADGSTAEPELTDEVALATSKRVWDRLYSIAVSEPEVRAMREEISAQLELRGCTFRPQTSARSFLDNYPEFAAAFKEGWRWGTEGLEGRASIFDVLSSERRDYDKLQLIKHRMEDELRRPKPVVNEVRRGSARSSSASSAHKRKSAASASSRESRPSFPPDVHSGASSLRVGRKLAPAPPAVAPTGRSYKPSDLWEKVIAEVEQESMQKLQRDADTKNKPRSAKKQSPTGPRSSFQRSSTSPTIHDRLYREGLERMAHVYAQREAEKENMELSACTFHPELSSSFLADPRTAVPEDDMPIFERLYQSALDKKRQKQIVQEEADRQARANATIAVRRAAENTASWEGSFMRMNTLGEGSLNATAVDASGPAPLSSLAAQMVASAGASASDVATDPVSVSTATAVAVEASSRALANVALASPLQHTPVVARFIDAVSSSSAAPATMSQASSPKQNQAAFAEPAPEASVVTAALDAAGQHVSDESIDHALMQEEITSAQ
jgi:hypothetical protein